MSTSTPLKKEQKAADTAPGSDATVNAATSQHVKSSKPVSTQVTELVKTVQFAWFAGHLTTIYAGVAYILSYRFFHTSWFNAVSYRLLYISVLESFGIILYQTYSSFQLGKLIHDDNFQYFVIAGLLLLSPFIYSLSILPFLIFAIFHSLNYFKSLVLPILNDAFPARVSLLNHVGVSIDKFVHNYNDRLIRLSSLIEILNFAIVVVKSLYFWGNWINVLIYSLFIKLRYMNSIYVRGYFSQLEVQVDGLLSHPSVPVQVKKAWSILKSKIKFIGKYDLVNRTAPSPSTSSTTEKKDL